MKWIGFLSGVLLFCPSWAQAGPGVTGAPWCEVDGEAVTLYTLTNANGLKVKIATYGGIVTSIEAPGRDGTVADVVLGKDTLAGYVKGHPYFGCITGRYANRIAKGKFVLDGKTYTLAVNNGPNHLHGGEKGFDKRVHQARVVTDPRGPALALSRLSPDGEEGYPGNLVYTVTYIWRNDNALEIVYSAATDAPTVVNLTNHSYFNLGGHASGDVLGHVVVIHADRYTATDDTLIPTGVLAPVTGTPLDFTKPHSFGERIEADHPAIKMGIGYDHNFVINRKDGEPLALAATVTEPKSGRVLEVYTSEPGIQLYTGNWLDGEAGKNGATYGKRNAFCLEAQRYPDTPNKPAFPAARLNPGEVYTQTTVYKFTTAP